MSEFNDPFYFALPRGVSMAAVTQAEDHIAKTFGIRGKTEVVRHELAFTLCRLTGLTAS